MNTWIDHNSKSLFCTADLDGVHFSWQGLSAEKDNLDIVQHEWVLPKFEHRAEAVLRKIVSWLVSGSQVLY